MNSLRTITKRFTKSVITRNNHNQCYDIAFVGGGIVSLAAAQEIITRHPTKKVVVLEKEDKLGIHQTGHNSGVIHAGMYYKPGSMKAKLCVEGLKLMYQYCDENQIPYKRCGKLIVAVSNDQVMPLQEIYDRGKNNKVEGLCLIAGREIQEIEPHCKGIVALHSANTGIVDYQLVTESFGKKFQSQGGVIINKYEVTDFQYNDTNMQDGEYPVKVVGKDKQQISCKSVITCGGLFSDRLASITGCKSSQKIIPFRGDYLVLKKEKNYLVKGNIYPVPDPKFPFLGVHFTPRMDGSIWLGPNAILSFKREGYKLTDFSLNDTVESLAYSGLRNLLMKHWKYAAKELFNAFDITKTVKELQKFIPELRTEDVERGPSGVRAMAVDPLGNLVDDFVFDSSSTNLGKRCLHVTNAPSPAATSSLAIAKVIAQKYDETLLNY